MAYVAPSSRINGDVITATIWNQDVVDNMIAVAAVTADATIVGLAAVNPTTDQMIYATASNVFAVTSLTSFARTILDDADAATVRTTLGLAIGTNVQAYDAELAALAGVTSAADRVPYFTGSGTASVATFTAFARTIVGGADQAAVRSTLGTANTLEPTTDVDVTIRGGATNRSVQLTPTGTGLVVCNKALKLFGETADPVNDQDVSYDTGDGMMQARYVVGRVVVPGVFHTASASSTAVTATSDTVFSNGTTATIPANGLNLAGKLVKVTAWGTQTSSGSPSRSFWVKYNGVKVAVTATNTPGASDLWRAELLFRVVTTGASGTAISDATTQYGASAGAAITVVNTNITSSAVDLTGASALTFGVLCGATHSTVCTDLIIEVLK